MSRFYKVWKDKFWAIWLAKIKTGETALSNIFKKFSNCLLNIEVNEFDTLCNFIYEAYGLKKQARFKTRRTDHLISMPNVNLRMLGPSSSGILQHIKRTCIQACYFLKLRLKPVYLTQLSGVGNHALTVHSYHTSKTWLSLITLNL